MALLISRYWFALLISGLLAAAAGQDSQPATNPAGKKRLTLETLYGPAGKADFDGSYVTGLDWTADSRHLLQTLDGVRTRVDPLTGKPDGPTYDLARVEQVLRESGAFNAEAAAKRARSLGRWSSDRSAAMFEHEGQTYVYRLELPKHAAGGLRQLLAPAQPHELYRVRFAHSERQESALSPSGNYISYINENDLYVCEVASGVTHRLTRGGNEDRLNGILDWVYQEEIYGRGNFRGYWWSDDERHLAYLQLDETRVPSYTIVEQTPTRPQPEIMRYPKSGDPNPGVRLGIVGRSGGFTSWVRLPEHAPGELLITQVSWAPDGRLIFSLQDREQRWLELCDVARGGGKPRVLLRETTPAWVDPIAAPHWRDDGTFLWQSERDGWNHLYHYGREGTLLRQVTQGAWGVSEFKGVDADNRVYFTGTVDGVLQKHAYRVPLAGGTPERLTTPGHSHSVQFSPDFSLFIDTYSRHDTPPRVDLRRTGGDVVRVLSENRVAALSEYELGAVEYVRIAARDGHMLNARIIRPPGFDASRKYPVWCETYAGPEAPVVRDSWGGGGYMFDQYLAGLGLVVFHMDPRSASGESAESSWVCYQRMGVAELTDIEDCVRWLIAQGFVDPARIGLHGHSYGGYITSFSLTHSDLFALGIAGAPVTDWANYDSIYTERYMRTPANNREGYKASSVVEAAANLKGRLVLAHGLIDDNVHFQNTAQLIHAIQQKPGQFGLMVYPKDRHGFGHGGKHFRELMLEEIRSVLRP